MGSPPRVRGKGVKQSDSRVAVGITPAYAGKRQPKPWCQRPNGDHPCVCGEKRVAVARPTGAPGSPPRMRGKAKILTTLPISPRITPAYAGKSGNTGQAGKRIRSCKMSTPVRDHPRVCGEKPTSKPLRDTAIGSPPRMRGKVFQINRFDRHAGITPAYAGKSSFPLVKCSTY